MSSNANRLRTVPLEHRTYMLVDEVMGEIGRTINYFYDHRDELIDDWGFPQPAHGARPYRVSKELAQAWITGFIAGLPAKDLKVHMAKKRAQLLNPANDEEEFGTEDHKKASAVLLNRIGK